MGDPFDAIGFNIHDEASYQNLAEESYRRGTPSVIYRRNALLQGSCWAIGEGIEIWTVMHETKEVSYYADCRPAFRSSRAYQCQDWEIIEFLEDGEALVSGRVQSVPLLFELQNFTDLDESIYQQPVLTTSLSGLCYTAKLSVASQNERVYSLCPSTPSRSTSQYAENDYLIQGKIHAWRTFVNPITEAELVWLEVAARGLLFELLVSRAQCQGNAFDNAWITAEAWLQGHLISPRQQRTKFEGLDFSSSPADLWATLKREN